MLTDSDIDRMNDIMDRVLARREEREFPPDRDEDRIAEILHRAERAAEEEHARLLETVGGFGSSVKYQEPVYESDEEMDFPNLDRYRNWAEE